MAENDCEIEYLDEDADIVQHIVKTADTVAFKTIDDAQGSSLLVAKEDKKRKKVESDDSDYDPLDDLLLKPVLKKKKIPLRYNSIDKSQLTIQNPPRISLNENNAFKCTAQLNSTLNERKKCTIRIPDFEDPLCLPVRMMKMDTYNMKQLQQWNKICLGQLQHKDELLTLKEGDVVSSKRTVMIKNVKNKISGRIESSVWGKTIVENDNGQTKSMIYQGILPKFKDKINLDYYLSPQWNKKNRYTKTEVLLTKEMDKDGEILVAYRPGECLSSVYKIEKNDCQEEDDSEENKRVCLIETTSCKMCVCCYQNSWRGARKLDQSKLPCKICNRIFVSLYSLLSHLKTHSVDDVRKCKHELSKEFAKAMEYHYRCKICRTTYTSIKDLRRHVVAAHRCNKMFHCEVGNHMTL